MMKYIILALTLFTTSATFSIAQIVDHPMPEPNQTMLDKCKDFYAELRTQPDKDWQVMKEDGPGEDSYFTLNIDTDAASDARYVDSLNPTDIRENGFKKWCMDMRDLTIQNPDESEEAAMCKADLNNYCDNVFNPL